MKPTFKRGTIAGIVTGAALLTLAGTAFAVAGDAPPAGHEGTGTFTAGDYHLWVRQHTADGEGMGTGLDPHKSFTTKALQGNDTWRPTVLKFSAGNDFEHDAVFFTYPIPADGGSVACVATGTQANPVVHCETKP